MVDLRQTPQYATFMKSIGWVVERENAINYFIKKIPFIGSFIKIQRPNRIDIERIDNLIHKYKAFQIVIEPKDTNQQSLITNSGFRQSRIPFIPAKTIYINLTKSEKQLLFEMHSKTRYNIKKATNNKLQVTHSNKIEEFAEFWQKCALKQRGMFLSQKKEIVNLYKAFGKNIHLIFIHKKGEILSGVLMPTSKEIAYYMYAASSDIGKKLFAPTLNTWEAIKLAKGKGCEIFDFEGIFDERFPLKSWIGFTRFKKSFGGTEIKYPGAFTKYFFPF